MMVVYENCVSGSVRIFCPHHDLKMFLQTTIIKLFTDQSEVSTLPAGCFRFQSVYWVVFPFVWLSFCSKMCWIHPGYVLPCLLQYQFVCLTQVQVPCIVLKYIRSVEKLSPHNKSFTFKFNANRQIWIPTLFEIWFQTRKHSVVGGCPGVCVTREGCGQGGVHPPPDPEAYPLSQIQS